LNPVLKRLLTVCLWVGGGLLIASAQAAPFVSDEPPEWSDEAPVVSRLIEEGHAAQTGRQFNVAAARYCAAARYGSVEAFYRIGRLLLERQDVSEREQGRSVLALAAQRGHLKAQLLLNDEPPLGVLPDCLVTGEAPVLSAVGDAHLLVVPSEVVDRYVLALPTDQRRHALLIQRLAPRFDVDGRLALAIARAESNFNPRAVSPKNAQGLMQLLPDTATRFGVRNTLDPEQNVRGGLAYLRWLLVRFDGNVALASAAYNAGENAVDRHGGVPPYTETQDYVQRILRFYRSPTHIKP
jgi:Transglycosylase SLT domain